MLAPQSPAFLSAKKCQRDSGEHFSEPSDSGGHLFDRFYPRPTSGADLFSLRGRVPSREATFLTVFAPSHIGSGLFQSARSCPESGDHLFDRFYPRPTSGADLFSLRGRVPIREATFLTVFTPVPHRERTFSVCEVVSQVGRPPFSL